MERKSCKSLAYNYIHIGNNNVIIFYTLSLNGFVHSRRPFDYMAVAGSGKVGPVNQVNHTIWLAVVTPTDRPKSVCNRCVIELFLWHCLCCHFALMTFLLVYGLLS